MLAGSIARAHGVFYHLDPWNRTVGYTLLAAFFGSLLVMAVTDGPDRALGRFFRGRVLRFLGKYSYGLYVYHFLLLPTFRRLVPRRRVRPPARCRSPPACSCTSPCRPRRRSRWRSGELAPL